MGGVTKFIDRIELFKSIGILLHDKDIPGKYDAIEDAMYDPITCELMTDPVFVTVSGHTYERSFIEKYIKEKKIDPLTQQTVTLSDIVPNRLIKRIIDDWREQNP